MAEEIHELKKGQVHIVNIALCGKCKMEIRFPFYSSRVGVDSDIIKIYKWVNTEELGLLCPECYELVKNDVTKIDYQGIPT